MINLLNGIQTAFTGSGLSGSFANGLEVGLAKDAEVLPLCVLTLLPPATPMFQSPPSPYIEPVIGQFSVYSTDPDFVMGVEAQLNTIFNNVSLTLVNDVCVCSRKNGGGNPYRDSDDARVWRVDLFYKFWTVTA